MKKIYALVLAAALLLLGTQAKAQFHIGVGYLNSTEITRFNDGTNPFRETMHGFYLGGTFNIKAQSNGSRGIQTDGNITISEADNATTMTIEATGGKCTVAADSDDPHKCWGMKIDGDMTVNAGTITVTKNGSTTKKGIKVGGTYKKNGGTVSATIDNE
jgi:hypothetical protein